MAGDERMEPLERLLNLVGLLLEARTPVTFEQIRDTLHAYGPANHDTAKRMFERDKDILREYGVPLELVDTDAWGTQQGYFIDKDRYYLPEIAFTPEELAALFVASQGGGEDTAAEQGVRKLLYGAQGGVMAGLAGGPLASGSDARSDLVLTLAEVAQARRRVRFDYRTSEGRVGERVVDAYAMVFRGGRWYLVGRDHARDDVRAFRVSRFTSDPILEGAGGEPPEGFRAADHVQRGPWTAGVEDSALVAFGPEASLLAQRSFPGAERVLERADGRVEISLPFADRGSLAGLLLEYGPDAEVLQPEELRLEMIDRLEAMAHR